MKYKYCQGCKKAYVRSRLEKDNCIYCNEPCETVDVKRNGLYWIGYSVMIIGAGGALYPRIVEVDGSTFYLTVGVVLAIGGAALVMMGSIRMAQAAANMASRKNQEE